MSDEKAKSRKSEKVGEVVSTKMAKTIVVQVTRRSSHRLYQRVVTKRKKFYAHDEEGTAKMGDTVRIVESRPLSKLKKWRLSEVLRRAAQVSIEPESIGDLTSAPAGQTGKR
jgi:small subunit ribosomal protein S17